MDDTTSEQREQDLAKAAARFRAALEMHTTGVRMMRLNLRRKFPGASESELSEKLRAWLWSRGDGPYYFESIFDDAV